MCARCMQVFDQLKSWCAANDFYKAPGRCQRTNGDTMDSWDVTVIFSEDYHEIIYNIL